MPGFGFLIIFGLNCMLFPCEGKINPPPGGTFLSGSTVRLNWTFDHDPSRSSLSWFFRHGNSLVREQLGAKFRTFAPIIDNSSLPGVAVENPATLVLNNVDERYNGTYIFGVGADVSKVIVVIVVAPNATFSCPNPSTVNEGSNFTCVCRGEGGNPPADVTWYNEDGVQIGEAGKEEQLLTLTNVTKSATYMCKAQNHIIATDEKSIKVNVRPNYTPTKTTITFAPEPAVVDESVTISCKSDGFPEPSYNITHNGTEVSTDKMHIISEVKWSDAGTYQCIAKNKLGRNSDSAILTVVEPEPITQPIKPSTTRAVSNTSITIPTPTKGNGPEKAVSEESNCSGTEWYIVVVTLMSGIIIGILLSYIVLCSRRKCRSRKPQSNPEPPTSQVDTTYQELDLTKMNTEDNYQSLTVNAARHDGVNDDDSTYTELNTARDVENNYQSLT